MEIVIDILPSGEIMIESSADHRANNLMLELLKEIIVDPDSLAAFLQAANQCEQIFGDETLCG